jgi:hypothetical protein
MRYVYLGDALTEASLVGQPCDPVRREDGKCIVSTRMATALVVFGDGRHRVVKRRRLRVASPFAPTPEGTR